MEFESKEWNQTCEQMLGIVEFAYRGRDDQRELAVPVVVVHRFTEYESGSVAGFEWKFPFLVAFHYRIVHVAVRRVRFVSVHRVYPAKYRHACPITIKRDY